MPAPEAEHTTRNSRRPLNSQRSNASSASGASPGRSAKQRERRKQKEETKLRSKFISSAMPSASRSPAELQAAYTRAQRRFGSSAQTRPHQSNPAPHTPYPWETRITRSSALLRSSAVAHKDSGAWEGPLMIRAADRSTLPIRGRPLPCYNGQFTPLLARIHEYSAESAAAAALAEAKAKREEESKPKGKEAAEDEARDEARDAARGPARDGAHGAREGPQVRRSARRQKA